MDDKKGVKQIVQFSNNAAGLRKKKRNCQAINGGKKFNSGFKRITCWIG
jgi:hypothetical protein